MLVTLSNKKLYSKVVVSNLVQMMNLNHLTSDLIKADDIQGPAQVDSLRADAEDSTSLEAELSVHHADGQGSRQGGRHRDRDNV